MRAGHPAGAALAVLCVLALASLPAGAATFELNILDGANVGFNDNRAATPVAGNPGTTVGEQRVNVFHAAAREWGNRLVTPVDIVVDASWDSLSCMATTGTLAQASPTQIFRFTAGTVPALNTWYPWALINAIIGREADPTEDEMGHIDIDINVDVGTPGCIGAGRWDYRLGVPIGGASFSLFTVLLHELGHGLGYLSFVDPTTGEKLDGRNDAYMRHLEDHSQGKDWTVLSDAGRLASMTDSGDLHWTGGNTLLHTSNLVRGRDDTSSHPLMFAPATPNPGSSVSHFDPRLSGHLDEIMEPMLTSRMGMILTDHALQDMGWPVTYLAIRPLENIDGLGAEDVAVLQAGTSSADHVVRVFDPDTGQMINEFDVAGGRSAIDIEVMSSFRGTPASEIATLAWNATGRGSQVFMNDASSGQSVRILGFPPSFPKRMRIISSFAGSSADEIALYAGLPNEKQTVWIKDALSGATLTTLSFPAGVAGDIGVVPSYGGSAAPEIVTVFTDPATGLGELHVNDASSGAVLDSWLLPAGFLPQRVTVVSNFGSSGASEVGILGLRTANGNPQLIVVDPNSGVVLMTRTFPDRFHAREIATVPDFAGTGADEIAIVGRRTANLRVRLLVVDASSGAAITTTTVPQLRENPHSLAVVASFDGSLAPEVLLLTTDTTDGTVRFYVKDGRGLSLGNVVVGEF